MVTKDGCQTCLRARWTLSRLAKSKRVLLPIICAALCLFYVNLHNMDNLKEDYGDSAVVIVEKSLPEVDARQFGITDPAIQSNGNTTNLTISHEIKLIVTPRMQQQVNSQPHRVAPAPIFHPAIMQLIREKNKTQIPQFSCRQIGLSKTKLPVTALASFAGSGSTWARHLIEQVTGFVSSSVYEDKILEKVFPYKLLFNGSASVVKTHERADDDGYVRFARFHRAILVLRNPYDAIKADFNQVYAGHTEMIPAKSFSKERWRTFLKSGAQVWLEQMVSWLVDPRPLFLLKYDDLKQNLTQTLAAAANFLEMETSDEIINCAQKNSNGKFLRAQTQNQTDLAVFTENDKKTTDRNIKIVNWYIERRCPHSPWCLPHAEVNFTGKPWALRLTLL